MEIHYADKAYRKRSLWLLAGIVLMCGVLLWQLQSWLDSLALDMVSRHDPASARYWVRLLLSGLGFAMAIPSIGLAMNLHSLARAAQGESRFPPSEWKTLRDVRVTRGAEARIWARRVRAGGSAALALGGLFLGWAVWAWWHFS